MNEQEEIVIKHRLMVIRLKKPGADILGSLDAWKCDLLHMVGCLQGEAAELYDATCANSSEIQEELGDFAFYLVGCRLAFRKEAAYWCGKTDGPVSPVANSVELMRLGGHLWDVAKRGVIYGKPFDIPDKKYDNKTLFLAGNILLDQMEEKFNAIVTFYNHSLEEVLEANFEKLANANTGRYSKGSYSDLQAQERLDKAV